MPWISDLVGRIVARWMRAAHAWPRATLFGLAVLCIGSVLAASTLTIDSDSSNMLSPDLPAQQAAHELNAAFPSLKSAIIVTVEARQADLADLAAIALTRALRAESATVAAVFAPSEDTFLAAHGFLYRDVDAVETMFARLSKSSNLLAHLRADQTLEGFVRALHEAVLLAKRAEIGPDALERLFAETASVLEAQTLDRPRVFAWSTVLDDKPSGTVTRLIAVTPVLDNARLSPAKPALQAIRAAIAALPGHLTDGVEIRVTGEPALRTDETASVTGTIGFSLAASLVLVTALLWIGLGRAGRVAVALGALVVSLILATGFTALAIGSLNLISVAFIVLMVGLGVDFAIHVMAHITEEHRAGSETAEAIGLTGQRSGLALTLSALTTALAFLAFTVTDFIGMAQLGEIGAGGVILAFLTAITLIPAVLALAPGLAVGRAGGLAPPLVVPRAAPWVILAVTAAALWPAAQARFDADPMGLRDPDAPSVQAFRALALDPGTSPYRASVLVTSAAEADRVADRLNELPEVAEAINLGDLIPDSQEHKLMQLDFAAASLDHAVAGQPTALTGERIDTDDPLATFAEELAPMAGMADRLSRAIAAYAVVRTEETDKALAERIFLTFGLLNERLGAMLNADTVSAAALPAAMRERFLTDDGTYRVEVLPRDDLSDPKNARQFAAAVRAVAPDAAGPAVQLTAAGDTVAGAMLTATLLAAAMTAALTLAATARLSDTVAVLAPLAVAGVLTAAFSTLAGVPFNYANVIVLPLMIGIGVDSGIHLALRARRAPGAVFATSTPRAVVLSALTTIAAFGTLAISDHRGTASMGILLTASIAFTLVAVLILTPALVQWTSRNRF